MRIESLCIFEGDSDSSECPFKNLYHFQMPKIFYPAFFFIPYSYPIHCMHLCNLSKCRNCSIPACSPASIALFLLFRFHLQEIPCLFQRLYGPTAKPARILKSCLHMQADRALIPPLLLSICHSRNNRSSCQTCIPKPKPCAAHHKAFGRLLKKPIP